MIYTDYPMTWYAAPFSIFALLGIILIGVSFIRWWTGRASDNTSAGRPGSGVPLTGLKRIAVGLSGSISLAARFFAFGVFFLFWGLGGLALNDQVVPMVIEALPGVKGWDLWTIRMFVGLAVLADLVLSGGVALIAARLVCPPIVRILESRSGAPSSPEFVGKRAEVSTILSPHEDGMILIDAGSGVVKAKARLVNYKGPELTRGEELLIIGYDEGIYSCVPWKKVVD